MEDKRFNVVKNENGCDLVTPITITPTEFGHIKLRMEGKPTYLHRFVYEKKYGKIPKGMVVRHKCDNPNCINPEHLELGSHGDNVKDRVERNRSAKGANNGRAKLTEDNVKYIRNDDVHSNSELAKMFNVDSKVIRDIKQFKTWKHVS